MKPILCLMVLAHAVAVFGQEVRVVTSSKAGARMETKTGLRFEDHTNQNGTETIEIDPSKRFQAIAGFGATFLEAGLICINSLPSDQQEQVLERLFDPVKGAGFSAMKTPLAGTDFMSAGPWYTYNDHPGDVAMEHFSIERDLGTNGLVTFIKRARKYGQFVLQAPMDYPPDWMLFDVKTNQNVQPRYFDALAHYYLRYLKEYEKQGVIVDYLSLFNEPGIYTKIPYRDIRELLKNHVGPLIKKEAPKTRLMLSESPTRQSALKEYPTVLDDPEARQFVAVAPYHGYDLNQHSEIMALHHRFRDIPVWMTEICHAYQAGTSKAMVLPRTDFEDGAFWGQQIFADIQAGASAWIYWNMILDENGGPWAVSPIHGNPDPNVQHPVVIINRKTGEVTYTGCYYYLAHFSKFVRPGSVRVATAGQGNGVECVAFETPDKKWVCQLMNRRSERLSVAIGFKRRKLSVELPASSINTCLW